MSKAEAYEQVLESLRGLVCEQTNWICNAANASSLLWHMFHALPAPSSSVNWSGFYVVDKQRPEQLILGPFHGKVACQTISIGKGVCGTVAARGEAMLLKDVQTFPGHIACDGDSKSELVVPIIVDGKVRGPFVCLKSSGVDAVRSLESLILTVLKTLALMIQIEKVLRLLQSSLPNHVIGKIFSTAFVLHKMGITSFRI